MSDYPLISVLLPFYNSEQYLAQAIASILNQTYHHFELILLDDGSSDGGLAIAQKYADLDQRIRIIHHPNLGICKTLQKGVNIAQGKYIARMDADDIAFPNRFELQVNYLEQHPSCVVLGSGIIIIDSDEDIICTPRVSQDHESILSELLKWQGPRLCHPTVVMRTQAVKECGGYEQSPLHEDIDLFLKLTQYGKLANLPERLLKYRWQLKSISHTTDQVKANKIKEEILLNAKNKLKLDTNGNCQKIALAEKTDPTDPELTSSDYNSEYETYRRWCLIAREARFYRSSFKYLCRILQLRILGTKTSWTVLCFLFGEPLGSLVWQRLLQVKQLLSMQ